MPTLTSAARIRQDPESFVRACGTVVRRFDHLTQDSGNVSWLVEAEGRRLFVKTAGPSGPMPPGAPRPLLDHAGRTRLLRNAVRVARTCEHPALPRLLNVVESTSGPMLVYEGVAGHVVWATPAERGSPESAYQRFAMLEAGTLLALLGTVIEVHERLAEAGWVAVDLYDGSLVVDFEAPEVHVVDLDSYRRGPSTNDRGRMPGSARFLAPEERRWGARIDERTTVYTLGRIAWHFATRSTEDPARLCGPPDLTRVLRRACAPSPEQRFATVAEMARAWRQAV